MNDKHYYVVIVGSGPAGLGVAEVIKSNSILSTRTLILEKGYPLDKRTCAVREGKKCKSCKPCNILSGMGGAGPYTDGKICLYQQDLNELFSNSQENKNNEKIGDKINHYLERVQKLWTDHGATDFKELNVSNEMDILKAEALKQGIDYVCYSVLHIGSDGAKKVLDHYIREITNSGIRIETNSNVDTIKKIKNKFEITYQKINDSNVQEIKVTADFLVLALGRDMQKPTYINKLLNTFKLNFKPKNLEIGCRVECPYQIMEDVTNITFDPKFIMITKTYQDYVRTFCTCPKGKVVREGDYVNGHVDRTALTQNTNFAILVEWPLDRLSLDDAMEHGNRIAQLALSEGRGKPIIQRVGDLRRRIPSTLESIKKSHIKPTLRLDRHVTPASIDSCYPERIVTNILEGLEKLDSVVKGVNDDQNLLYAPEIKPTCAIHLKEGVKTEVPNLYVCGDFSGYTRGIAQAMCMGLMVGEDILNEVKKGFQLKLDYSGCTT